MSLRKHPPSGRSSEVRSWCSAAITESEPSRRRGGGGGRLSSPSPDGEQIQPVHVRKSALRRAAMGKTRQWERGTKAAVPMGRLPLSPLSLAGRLPPGRLGKGPRSCQSCAGSGSHGKLWSSTGRRAAPRDPPKELKRRDPVCSLLAAQATQGASFRKLPGLSSRR